MSRSHSDVELMLSGSYNEKHGGNREKNTEFDSNVPEAYSTIETAQQEHAKYHAHQVKNPESQSRDPPMVYDDVIPTSEGSVSVSGVTGGGGTEDGSGGGVVTSGGSLPRRRLEAKNVLYEDNELPQDGVHHRGVHAASYTVYPKTGYSEGGKWSHITCSCQTKTLIASFFVSLALLLAVASLVLSVLLWFGVYDASPSSTSSTSTTSTSTSSSSPPPTTSSPIITTDNCHCPDKAKVEELNATLEMMKQRMEAFRNLISQNTATRDSLSSQLSLLQTNISNLTAQLALWGERPASLSGVAGLEQCTSEEPLGETCTIQVQQGDIQNPCLTPGHPVEDEGKFLVSAECVKKGDALTSTQKIAMALETLIQGGVNKMRCRCSLILDQPSDGSELPGDHYCALRVTRCPIITSHNATLSWQR